MTMCKVKHDPPHSYGDCVSACIGTIFADRDDVPHFFHDGDGEAAFERMREWLAQLGLIPAYFPIDGNLPFNEVMAKVGLTYGLSRKYLLFCSTTDGDHCIVCEGADLFHNPAWYASPIVGPHSSGKWIVIFIARVGAL